jgi:hypothetical protein
MREPAGSRASQLMETQDHGPIDFRRLILTPGR